MDKMQEQEGRMRMPDIEALVDDVLNVQFLKGLVMEASHGVANPSSVERVLKTRLSQLAITRKRKMNDELLGCPFCGGEGSLLQNPRDKDWSVLCIKNEDCDAHCSFDIKEDAIKQWNTRAKPTFTQEDLSKATTAIAKMPCSSFREGSKLKIAMLGEDMTPIAKAALEAVGGKIV